MHSRRNFFASIGLDMRGDALLRRGSARGYSGEPHSALMNPARNHFAPRIYYFHPLLAGAPSSWAQHLGRCEDMGFDHVLLAPIFAPGTDGDIFLTDMNALIPLSTFPPMPTPRWKTLPDPAARMERARTLIENAEALGEPPEDPLLLYSVLFGFWVVNFVAFNN